MRRDTLRDAEIIHKRTRPHRPQTNGKVERFTRTLLDAWAYHQPYPSETERRQALPHCLHAYKPPTRPHRTRRPTTRHPRPQPHRAIQLDHDVAVEPMPVGHRALGQDGEFLQEGDEVLEFATFVPGDEGDGGGVQRVVVGGRQRVAERVGQRHHADFAIAVAFLRDLRTVVRIVLATSSTVRPVRAASTGSSS
ncbi:transposase [Amycolatopsis sp. FDAARGOS 1241]|nr:transposase [Amycolatopsis sp. FDAARGOS 1241]